MIPKANDNSAKTKVVLITGALSDIGRAIAEEFARAGYAIALNHRSRVDEASAFSDSLRKDLPALDTITCQADVRSRPEIHNMFEKVFQTFGRLDVLVNNAGINIDKPFLDMTDEEWDTVVSTILSGTFMCSQEFARRYSGTEGNIINIGAVTAIKGRKNGANYCSARAGILALTKCMALELAPRIRVNAVTPGRINTDELRTRYNLDEPMNLQRSEQEIPLKCLGAPDDIANIILYLVTKGHYITGQNFFVDGGLFMR